MNVIQAFSIGNNIICMKKLIFIVALLLLFNILSGIIRINLLQDGNIFNEITTGQLLLSLLMMTLYFPVVEEIVFRSTLRPYSHKRYTLMMVTLMVYFIFSFYDGQNAMSIDNNLYALMYNASSYVFPIATFAIYGIVQDRLVRFNTKIHNILLLLLYAGAFTLMHHTLYFQNYLFNQTGYILTVLNTINLLVSGFVYLWLASRYSLYHSIFVHALYNLLATLLSYGVIVLLLQ